MCSERDTNYEIDVMGRCIRIDHRLPGRAQIEQLADEGVSLIMSDIDGTLTDGHEGSVCPEVVDLSRAVQGADMQLALVSNNTNQRFVASVASQLGVPLEHAFSPRRPRDWKPLPTMVGQAVRETEESKDRTLVIGDGVTDMLAAVLAGCDAVMLYCAILQKLAAIRCAAKFVQRRISWEGQRCRVYCSRGL